MLRNSRAVCHTDVATDYSAFHASPLAFARGRPKGRLATKTSPMKRILARDPGGGPESRLWAAVVLTGSATVGAETRLPYGFSATTLPFFQKYTGVPCMRATLRAVFAARRIPRSIPASHLSDLIIALNREADRGCHISVARRSGSLRLFATLDFAFADPVAAVFLFARFLAIH
jgi:hypothetical protein